MRRVAILVVDARRLVKDRQLAIYEPSTKIDHQENHREHIQVVKRSKGQYKVEKRLSRLKATESTAPQNRNRNSLWMSNLLKEKIAKSRLLLVGCGGLGSLLIVHAAHLGFRHFTIVDSDVLESSNLNRFVVAAPRDVGTHKASLLKSYLLQRFPNIVCFPILNRFPCHQCVRALQRTSLVIGCLDDVKTRIELDLHTRAAGLKLVDLGCGFVVEERELSEKKILNAGGQVIISRPEGPCLKCLGFEFDATRNTYYLGDEQPDPSSVLLNSLIVSLALECILKELVGELAPLNRIEFDRQALRIEAHAGIQKSGCRICGINSRILIQSVAEADPFYGTLQKLATCKIV